MNAKSIGIFDSGLGGLTAVKELIKRMPKEDIVYFGDTGRVPYGTRSNETIIKYTMQDIRFLMQHNIKMILIACGTASSVAMDIVKDQFDIPIIGVVDASIEAAIKATKTKKVAVLGTNGTIGSGAYQKKLIAYGIEAFPIACPLFVPLVENNYLTHKATYLIAQEYLSSLMNKEIDTIILGCTHYPLLKTVISDIMGSDVTLIDSGAETVSIAFHSLKERNLLNDKGGSQEFFVSDSIADFSRFAGLFLEQEIAGKVDKVDIERY